MGQKSLVSYIKDISQGLLAGAEQGYAGTSNMSRAMQDRDDQTERERARQEEINRQDKNRNTGYARTDARNKIVDERTDARNKVADTRYDETKKYRQGRDTVGDTRYTDTIKHRDEREGVADVRYETAQKKQNAPWSPGTSDAVQTKKYLDKTYRPESDPSVKKTQFLNSQKAPPDMQGALKGLKDKDGFVPVKEAQSLNDIYSDSNYVAVPVVTGKIGNFWLPEFMEKDKGKFVIKKKDEFGYAKGQIKEVKGKYYRYNGGDSWDEA